jgi:hypothetical protein
MTKINFKRLEIDTKPYKEERIKIEFRGTAENGHIYKDAYHFEDKGDNTDMIELCKERFYRWVDQCVREENGEFKGMDFAAMCKYTQGDVTKEQAEEESKIRGWKPFNPLNHEQTK